MNDIDRIERLVKLKESRNLSEAEYQVLLFELLNSPSRAETQCSVNLGNHESNFRSGKSDDANDMKPIKTKKIFRFRFYSKERHEKIAGACYFVWIALIVIAAVVLWNYNPGIERDTSYSNREVEEKIPIFDEPIQPLPENGTTWNLAPEDIQQVFETNINNGAFGAVSIKVPDGTKSYYVIVKMFFDSGAKETAKAVFIRPGQTVEVILSVFSTGSYCLYYATGENWYGQEFLFGPDTQYSKADETMDIRERGIEWIVELISRIGGNLSTSEAYPSDFK